VILSAQLATLSLLLAQVSEPIAATPHDRVIELEITEHDEIAIEGRGGTAIAEYEVQFDGTLHVWAESELDLFLRIDDAAEARTLDSDNDSGGGTTPYLGLDVQAGDWLVVLVAGPVGATGSLTLNMIAAPETEATRATVANVRRVLRDARRYAADGNLAEARAVVSTCVAMLEGAAGNLTSSAVGAASFDAATRCYRLDVLDGARDLYRFVLAVRKRTLPEDHPDLTAARSNLGVALRAGGDLDGALALREAVVAAYERSLPEGHRDLLRARMNLALSMGDIGDLAGARVLKESVLAVLESTLPEDHPEVLRVRLDLASSMYEMGDLAAARMLQESVLSARERTLPEDHADLLRAQGDLASTLYELGELAGARALYESVLEAYERTLPEDNPRILRIRGNLATSMHETGDLAGARALYESVLSSYEATLPEDHPDVMRVQANLIVAMHDMGDLAGARAMHESLLAAFERTFPEDHPDVLQARGNLGILMRDAGDHAGALAVGASIVAARERTLPEDHPDLLHARGDLAAAMDRTGDPAGARSLLESVVAAYERTLPEDHHELLGARLSLAASMCQMGDLAPGRALYESLLGTYERTRPEDHPDLLRVRGNLARSVYRLGDLEGARALLPDQLDGMRMRVIASLAFAPRQARQTVASEGQRHSEVLFLSASAGSGLERSAFELTETMRLVAAEAARSLARFEEDPELASTLQEAVEVRRALSALVAGGGSEERGTDELSGELTRLSLRRDALERQVSHRLAERGVAAEAVDSHALTSALAPGDIAVGYRRIRLRHLDPSSAEILEPADHLLAHVLESDGNLSRVDLGPASELEDLAREWRAALGVPIVSDGALGAIGMASELRPAVASELRGIAAPVENGGISARAAELDAGRALRARILDPVLAKAKADTRRVFLCADDLLFLLPLDALPFDSEDRGGLRVGDRLQIVSEVSFAWLLKPMLSSDGAPSLLSVGGVDYGASAAVAEDSSAVSPPIGSDGDSATGNSSSPRAIDRGFQNLVQARREAEATTRLFEDAFGIEGGLLLEKGATKAALLEAAPGKRYLHLATHGWFAPESVRSTEDARPEGAGFTRMGLEDRVTGLAPMTLCGLALAGANRGRDSLGRVPGILTAEELCSLDLSQCELAVLSACETNVGIRRAGQGIQSLQSALYAAGARTSITSLWKVDDAATRRLMEAFYDNLWVQRMGKSDALWQAKQTMRDEGDPPAHWAGWVLTGDPD